MLWVTGFRSPWEGGGEGGGGAPLPGVAEVRPFAPLAWSGGGVAGWWWSRPGRGLPGLERALAAGGWIGADALICSRPDLLPLVGVLRPRRVLLAVSPALGSAPPQPAHPALDIADLVVSPSRGVVTALAARGLPARHLPPSVDPTPYAGEAPPLPLELRGVPGPRVACFGADGPGAGALALAEVARALPGVTFVRLEGGGDRSEGPDRSPRNVARVGPVPTERLPAVLRHCALALALPRGGVAGELDHPECVYPAAAAGLATVVASTAETRGMAGDGAPVLAALPHALADEIRNALRGAGGAEAHAREFASRNTDRVRFRQVEDWIGARVRPGRA